jgi:hypothetical protein
MLNLIYDLYECVSRDEALVIISNYFLMLFSFDSVHIITASFQTLVMYHRERILETSTLSCNEEEEGITKPPTR